MFEPFDCVNCKHYEYLPDDSYIEEQPIYTCACGIFPIDEDSEEDIEKCKENFELI